MIGWIKLLLGLIMLSTKSAEMHEALPRSSFSRVCLGENFGSILDLFHSVIEPLDKILLSKEIERP